MMKRVLFFAVIVCVLFVTGGTMLYASNAPVVREGTVDLADRILPQPAIEEAAMDYLQALIDAEKAQDFDAVCQVAGYFAEQFEVDSENTPLRWWPQK